MKNNKIRYCIIKSYKGIFTKTHTGNSQMYLMSLDKEIMGLVILGSIADLKNTYVCDQFFLVPIKHEDEIIRAMLSSQPNSEIIETINSKITTVVKGWEYKIKLSEKGRWISDNFDIEFAPEYSRANERNKIFLLKGKINLLIDDPINVNTIKMAALTHSAKIKSILASTELNKFII